MFGERTARARSVEIVCSKLNTYNYTFDISQCLQEFSKTGLYFTEVQGSTNRSKNTMRVMAEANDMCCL